MKMTSKFREPICLMSFWLDAYVCVDSDNVSRFRDNPHIRSKVPLKCFHIMMREDHADASIVLPNIRMTTEIRIKQKRGRCGVT